MERKDLYYTIFENCPDGVSIHQLLCNEEGKPFDGQFLSINSSFEKLTGLSSQEVLGRGIREVFPELEPQIEPWSKVVLEGEILQVEKFFREFGRYCKVSAFPIKPERFGCIFCDLTPYKKTEEEVRQTNEDLRELIRMVLHDLRSPLLNVHGYSLKMASSLEYIWAILQETPLSREWKYKISSLLEEDLLDPVRHVANSAIHMEQLFTKLFNVSQLGKTETNPLLLDMNRLLDEIISIFQLQIQESGVKIKVNELPSCYGNPIEIKRVFSNLLNNALKYLDPSRVGRIKISGREEGDWSIYSVEDNGIGISPNHREKVFKIFQRLCPKDRPGEGLGLAIVQRIVHLHRGKVWIESEEGKGSCFFVSLPRGDRDEV